MRVSSVLLVENQNYSKGSFCIVKERIIEATYGAIHRRIANLVLKALSREFEPSKMQSLKQRLIDIGGQSIQFETLDGASIDGMHFLGKNCNRQSPTIILFNGTWYRFEEYATTQSFDLKTWLDFGYNVLVFNYRGVGSSKGKVSRNGFVFDGEAAVKFVKDRLNVNHIILHGHSLGAGIASEVALKNPYVCFCSDRTFSSLSKQVRHMLGNCVIGTVASGLIRLFGWDYDIERNWDKIKGKKWILHLNNDPVIAAKARLADSFSKHVVKPVIITMDHGRNGHIRTLNERELKEHFEIIQN